MKNFFNILFEADAMKVDVEKPQENDEDQPDNFDDNIEANNEENTDTNEEPQQNEENNENEDNDVEAEADEDAQKIAKDLTEANIYKDLLSGKLTSCSNAISTLSRELTRRGIDYHD